MLKLQGWRILLLRCLHLLFKISINPNVFPFPFTSLSSLPPLHILPMVCYAPVLSSLPPPPYPLNGMLRPWDIVIKWKYLCLLVLRVPLIVRNSTTPIPLPLSSISPTYSSLAPLPLKYFCYRQFVHSSQHFSIFGFDLQPIKLGKEDDMSTISCEFDVLFYSILLLVICL